jgi:hypothetical protein
MFLLLIIFTPAWESVDESLMSDLQAGEGTAAWFFGVQDRRPLYTKNTFTYIMLTNSMRGQQAAMYRHYPSKNRE